MRKVAPFFITLIIFMSIIICSCKRADQARIIESKDADENKKALMISKTNFEEYSLTDMQQYSSEMQRAIFNIMSPEKRAALWRDRIDLAISEENNDEIIMKLKEVRKLLVPNIYSGARPQDAPVPAVSEWVERNMMLIGYDRMKQIVTSMMPKNSNTAMMPNPPVEKPDCECSLNSDWCSSAYERCKVRDCTGASWGCGIFGMYGCYGMCVQ
jgi:hypothetical protein